MAAELLGGSSWSLAQLMGYPSHSFWKKWPDQVRIRSYEVNRWTISYWFSTDILISAILHIELTGMERFCVIKARTWPHGNFDPVSWSFESHTSSLTLVDLILTNIWCLNWWFWRLFDLRPNVWFIFLQRPVNRGSRPFPLSIRALDLQFALGRLITWNSTFCLYVRGIHPDN